MTSCGLPPWGIVLNFIFRSLLAVNTKLVKKCVC